MCLQEVTWPDDEAVGPMNSYFTSAAKKDEVERHRFFLEGHLRVADTL